MIDFYIILKGTDFEDKAEMLTRACKQAGWSTIGDVQNLPRLSLPGVDVYALLATINEQHEAVQNQPKEVVEIPTKPKSRKKKEPVKPEDSDKEA